MIICITWKIILDFYKRKDWSKFNCFLVPVTIPRSGLKKAITTGKKPLFF